jgi:DNA-binding beta-propeller fold protein YncE
MSDAIEVAVSADGGYAFVSEEYSDRVAVFSLRRALSRGFDRSDYVGSVPLGRAVVGMAVSPDGRWLYATSEIAAGDGTGSSRHGTLSVIDVQRAVADPAASVVATVPAGCDPVRVVTSADGRQVWVTARESDALLCFDAALLLTDPRHALRAVVRVGAAPVGLATVRAGTRVIVADSDRFGSGSAADLAIVDVNAALAGRPAVLGRIIAGRFPRDMAATPDGQAVLVANFASAQLEVVNIASLP